MKYAADLKIVVFVPIKAAAKVRKAMHAAGAGNAGGYSEVSYSSRVINRYTPGKESDPAIGRPGEPQKVEEERIEFLCPEGQLKPVIAAMKKAHPYEEIAYDVIKRLEA